MNMALRRLDSMFMAASADPKSVQVKLTTGEGIEIEWKDGHCSSYTFSFLRDACPCAECSNRRNQENRRPAERRLLKLEDLGALRPVKATGVVPVGKYAIRIVWDDGHQHGDYSWDYLRDVCPCTTCTPRRPS